MPAPAGHRGDVAFGLVINELMSANANNVSDPFGEFDDWIELYNGGGSPVALGGKYLTDNLGDPDKFALPAETLAAGDWAFYWADNDPEQGPYHAPFTLSGSGDEVALLEWNEDGAVWVILDFFAFGASNRTRRWAATRMGPSTGCGSPRPRPMPRTTTPSSSISRSWRVGRSGSLRRTPRRTGSGGRETG